MHLIRPEEPQDIPQVHRLNRAAFGTAMEADLVDALRRQADPFVSLVAVDGDEVVGHIAFSPVSLVPHQDVSVAGLAPMSVDPARQRQGIGSSLVKAGLDELRRRRVAAVVVLGHPGYYPRFGFAPASTFGLSSDYEVPDDVFMALELTAGALHGVHGIARYHPAFASL